MLPFSLGHRRWPVVVLLLLLTVSTASSSSPTNKSVSSSSPFWKDWSIWFLRAGSSKERQALDDDVTALENKRTNTTTSSAAQSEVAVANNDKQQSEQSERRRVAVVEEGMDGRRRENSVYENANTTTMDIQSYMKNTNGEDDNDVVINDSSISSSSSSIADRGNQIMTNKRRQFLDRIAVISSSMMRKEDDEAMLQQLVQRQSSGGEEDDDMTTLPIDLDAVTPQSDLLRPGRRIHIVTTAALPWFTGTAVNPLLRAAYLHRKTQQINHPDAAATKKKNKNKKSSSSRSASKSHQQRWVTFVIPWLEWPEDQQTLYGRVFANSTDQESYIRAWLRDEAEMADAACPDTGLEIVFYPARYHAGLGSIFAMGDIMETVINSNNNQNTTNTTEEEDSEANNGTATTTTVVDSRPLDVCILEEPEHCNWYRAPGDGWTKRFNFVVGIVHTNYKEYANAHYSGLWTAPAIALMSSAMVRAYCHKVIKLSNTLQSYAVEKESTSNVHGVRSNFWQEGIRRAQNKPQWQDITSDNNTTQIYFIGKLLWAKGLDILLELEDYYKQYTGDYFPIDIYGSGPEQTAISRAFYGRRGNGGTATATNSGGSSLNDTNGILDDTQQQWRVNGVGNSSDIDSATNGIGDDGEKVGLHIMAKQKIAKFKESINAVDIQEKTKEHLTKIKESINAVDLPMTFAELVRRQPIPATFPGRVDHGTLADNYKIFMNPSLSEVLCTTTAEALAMGKFAIIPVHPSNTFFLQFPNCLAYRNKFEFVANLRWALTHDPEPLTAEQSHQFTWEAATERLISASAITWREALMRERLGLAKLDERIAWFHNELGKGTSGDFLRRVLGAGPASHQVKYQKEREADRNGVDHVHDNDEEDEDESGFSSKFRLSSFARAIRASLGDFANFGIQ